MTIPNDVGQFVEKARAEDLSISVDAPRDPNGEWWLDISDGRFHSELSWLSNRGFGVFVTQEAEFGTRPDEIYSNADDAVARVAQMRSQWKETKSVDPMWLKQLRQLIGTQQVKMAAALGVDQAEISRFENREHIQVSNLAQYIKAMGGELELRVKFEKFEARIDPSTILRRRRARA